MIYIILAFASGVLTLLSMIVNSSLGKRIGAFQSSFVNFFVGVISALILVFIIERKVAFGEKLHSIPAWAYFGGFLGVMVVIISNIIIPKIPTIYSTLLIFIGQLFTGIVFDYLTGMEISKGKVVGGLLILAGMAYNSMIDRKELEENGHE